MLVEWLIGLVQNKVSEWVSARVDRLRRRLEARRALDGGDTLGRRSAAGIVAACIEDLLQERALPVGALSADARDWLRDIDTPRTFCEYIIARQASDEGAAQTALTTLEQSYELHTGEASRLAIGHVRGISDYVLLRLEGQKERLAAFQTALAAESAVAHRRERGQAGLSSTGNNRERACKAATSLLYAAAEAWQLPERCIPFHAEVIASRGEARGTVTQLPEVIDFIRGGSSVVFSGEAGIGKTTALLNLCQELLANPKDAIPIFIEAPTWATRKLPIVDFLAELTAFRNVGIGTIELSQLISSGAVLLAINGWNEIDVEGQRDALLLLQQFVLGAPGAIFAVATRSSEDTFGLPKPVRVRVRGLDWERQKEMVTAALPAEDSAQLLARLGTDKNLRFLARNPLVLRALVWLQENRHDVPKTMFDILEGVQDMYEQAGLRASALAAAPLFGFHRHYMMALAVRMNDRGKVFVSEQDALSVLSQSADELHTNQQLAVMPVPRQLLAELCHQHLLHWDKGTRSIRFIHQRFQELYSANAFLERLERVAGGDNIAREFIREVINMPFWADAVLLASERLSSSRHDDQRRSTLIATAMQIDLAFACEIAGRSGLAANPGAITHDLCEAVMKLFNSEDHHSREYAVYAMLQSKLPNFGSTIWSLLESDDDQCRLTVYRLGEGVSFEQFGAGATGRLSKWTSSRRAEFVREAANLPENFPFIEEIALRDSDSEVRAAAIWSLAWNYPASDSALNAWLMAPDNVKSTHEVLQAVFYDGDFSGRAEVRADVERLARNNNDDQMRLTLAEYFPDVAGPYAVPAALAMLRQLAGRAGGHADALDMLRRYAPVRLTELTRELAVTARNLPPWVFEEVRKWTDVERGQLFGEVWTQFTNSANLSCDIEFVASLANTDGVTLIVDAYLARTEIGTATNAYDHRYDRVMAQLSSVCLAVDLLRRAPNSTQRQIQKVLSIIQSQVTDERSAPRAVAELRLSVSVVDSLVDALWPLEVDEVVQQHETKAHLCSVMAHVDAARYLEKIVDGLRLHLQAWQQYRRLVSTQVRQKGAKRLNNPYLTGYFITAGLRCGFAILPELLSMAAEPEADQVIHPLIADILAAPNLKANHPTMGFVGRPDISARKLRIVTGTVLQQADSTLQLDTDAAAAALTQILDQYLSAEASTVGGAPEPRAVWALGAQLSRIPSQVQVPSLERAMTAENMSVDAFLGCLSALVSQGYVIQQPAVIQRLRAEWVAVMAKEWTHPNDSWRVHEIASLLYFIQSAGYGQHELNALANEWLARTNIHEVVRELIRISSPNSWRSVFALISAHPPADGWGGEVLYGLSKLPCSVSRDLLLEIAHSGLLFALLRSEFDARNLAKAMAFELENDGDLLRSFLAACGQSQTVSAAWFACELVGSLWNPPASAVDFIFRYLDSSTYSSPWERACRSIEHLFIYEEPVDNSNGAFNRVPRACNAVRGMLFDVAVQNSNSSGRARSLLLSVELGRLILGRPHDEPRHPRVHSEIAWPAGFYES
ncbi:Predicted NTPase (NACHT family) [Burkholderia pseudomallei]|nr:Predicted NTPase (NACHT family) [Burkholderia pseudomallei]